MNKILLTFLLCMTFMLCKNVDAFASDSDIYSPNLPSNYDSYVILVPYSQQDYYYCYIYNSQDSTFKAIPSTNGLFGCSLQANIDEPCIPYVSKIKKSDYKNTNDNFGWGTFEQTKYNNSFSAKTILYCNQNLVDNEGTITFPQTPPLKETTEKALYLMTKKVEGDFLTLVTCGVACLISLVGLVILAKKFRLFLH